MPPDSADTSVSAPARPRVVAHSGATVDSTSPLVAVGFSSDDGQLTVGLGADASLARLGVDPFALLDRAGTVGNAGDIVVHELFDESAGLEAVVLVGLGSGRPKDYRRAGAALVRTARGRDSVTTSLGSLADDDQLAALVEGLVLGGFTFSRTSGGASAGRVSSDPPVTVHLTDIGPRARERVVEEAISRATASWRARTFALTPSNEKGPARLEGWAKEIADAGGFKLEVWNERRLASEGFGGILAVGQGSAYESRFLRLDYTPKRGSRKARHIVLVGKGITFDTGGISIKPRAAMETMKRDMTGAGVVIAVMGALRDLAIPVRVTGLVASAENAFGGASMRPGDVVTHYGGRTSEIGNTDAEGRLVLADALAYADQHLDADVVVDIATLTGAAKVALGTSIGAVFANDETLASALLDAGALAGEPLWRLPLSDQYEPALTSAIADATNNAGGPGAVTAALFLQHFAGSVPWAHLDIASVGDSPRDEYEYTAGATGFGARLLLRWLADA
jgi:leucyl aminopeptidase